MSTPSSTESAQAVRQWLWPLTLLLVACGGALQGAAWTSWPPEATAAGLVVSCALLACVGFLWNCHRRLGDQLAAQRAESVRLQEEHTANSAEQDRRWREWARSYDDSLRACLRAFAPELRAVMAEGAQGEVPAEAPGWLREELRSLLDLAGEIEDDHQDAYEHILVTLGTRMQSVALRMEAKARLGLCDHRDNAVRQIGMEITHEANQLVHITAGVRVLSGEWAGQQWPDPIVASEIVQAASGRIVDYKRVRVHGDPDIAVVPHAAEYIIHCVAELLQNATIYSPPGCMVHAWVEEDQDGLVIQVDDQGLGMTEGRLEDMRPIASGERPMTVRTLHGPQIGLAVVGNIARRFDLDVHLDRSRFKGLRAMVYVPGDFVEPFHEDLWSPGNWPEDGVPALDAPIAVAAAHPGAARTQTGTAKSGPPKRVNEPAAVPSSQRKAQLPPARTRKPGSEVPRPPGEGGPEWTGERTASGRLPKRRSGVVRDHNGLPILSPDDDQHGPPVESEPEPSAQETGAWLGAFVEAGRAPYEEPAVEGEAPAEHPRRQRESALPDQSPPGRGPTGPPAAADAPAPESADAPAYTETDRRTSRG